MTDKPTITRDASATTERESSVLQPVDAIWSLDETARHFGCSTKSVQKLTRDQGLPFFMIGRLWRFRRSDLLAWQAAQVEASKAVA